VSQPADRTIIRGDFQPTLEAALVARVRAAKESDAFANVRVLVPSNLLRVHLRRRLAEDRAFVGVRVDSLASLIEELTFAPRARNGERAMPGLAALLFAERAIAEMASDSTFDPLRAMPGFPDRLAATIRDLRDAAITPEQLAAATDSKKVRDLAALYAAVERHRREAKVLDDAALAELATAEVASHAALAADAILFVYGFYDFVTVQQRLIEALLARHGGTVFSPVPDGEAGEFGRRFLERLRALGFRSTESQSQDGAPGSDLALLRARLRDRLVLPGAEPRGDGSVRFLAPRFRGEEPRDVLRVVRDLVENGVALHEIGIVYRQRANVRRVAAEVARLERDLTDVAVPLFEQGGHALEEKPGARALLRLVDALRSNLVRNQVMAFLDATGRHPRTPAYARLARAAAIRGGEGSAEWDRALTLVAESKPRHTAADDAHDAEREAQRKCDAADATALRPILAKLEAARREIAAAKSHAQATYVLREAFVATCSESAAAELEPVFATLTELDEVADEFDAESFLDWIEPAIEGVSVRGGASFEKGLFAGGLLGARGLPFRVVILPALEEGVFPRKAAPDPLFLDDERQAVTKRLARDGEPGLPLAGSRAAAEERLLFHFACAAASERLVFSCPRYEDASDTEIVPSPAWRGALEALNGGMLPKGDVRRIELLRPLFVASTQPLDLAEWDRRCVANAARASDGASARFVAELDPIAAQAMLGELTRFGAEVFTEYDGALGGDVWGRYASAILGRPLGVTKIERFAMCPFKFFAGSVLAIDLTDPRQDDAIDVRMLGDVIHAAAEEFFRRLVKRGAQWPLDPQRRTEFAADLIAVGNAVFDEYVERSPLPRVLLDAARVKLADELLALLDYEYASTRSERPNRFEEKFGYGDRPPLELGVGNDKIRFAGSIDRVDVDSAKRTAVVIDYKTGAKKVKNADLAGGRQLQLLVYALEAQRSLGNAAAVQSSEYFYCSRVGGGKRIVAERAAFIAEGLEEVNRTVATLARSLRAGDFFADPSVDDLCKQCEVRLACGKGPALEKQYERKKSDPRVAALQALRRPPEKPAEQAEEAEAES
jgi:ATP-dependent helicase/nuclease subunit B